MPVTLQDLRWNHSILQMASYLNMVNFTLDPTTGQMLPKKIWRNMETVHLQTMADPPFVTCDLKHNSYGRRLHR